MAKREKQKFYHGDPNLPIIFDNTSDLGLRGVLIFANLVEKTINVLNQSESDTTVQIKPRGEGFEVRARTGTIATEPWKKTEPVIQINCTK